MNRAAIALNAAKGGTVGSGGQNFVGAGLAAVAFGVEDPRRGVGHADLFLLTPLSDATALCVANGVTEILPRGAREVPAN